MMSRSDARAQRLLHPSGTLRPLARVTATSVLVSDGTSGLRLTAVIRKALTGADEDEKKRFIAALQKHREANSKDIQTNVFKQCVFLSFDSL